VIGDEKSEKSHQENVCNLATQAFSGDETSEKSHEENSSNDATQAFSGDEPTQVIGDEKSGKSHQENSSNLATQTFSDDDAETFDISAVATLAPTEVDLDIQEDMKTPGLAAANVDATQVFDDHTDGVGNDKEREVLADDATQVVEDATVAVLDHTSLRKTRNVKAPVKAKTDATQVFDDQTVDVTEVNPITKTRQKAMPHESDATQVFDDQTVAVGDDTEAATLAVEHDSPVRKRRRGRNLPVADATQVFDDALEQKESQRNVMATDATQVIGEETGTDMEADAETQVIDQTVPVEQISSKPATSAKGRGGRGKKRNVKEQIGHDSVAETQVLDTDTEAMVTDETQVISDKETVAHEAVAETQVLDSEVEGMGTDETQVITDIGADRSGADIATQVIETDEDNVSKTDEGGQEEQKPSVRSKRSRGKSKKEEKEDQPETETSKEAEQVKPSTGRKGRTRGKQTEPMSVEVSTTRGRRGKKADTTVTDEPAVEKSTEKKEDVEYAFVEDAATQAYGSGSDTEGTGMVVCVS